MALAILYSYRRCPYAMRARMALKLAGIQVEIREISLRDKPVHMLQVSPKGTVPVLVLPDGSVIDESLEIMLFALKQHALGSNDPGHPLSNSIHEFDSPCIHAACRALIFENDTSFKQALGAYKYPEKHPSKTQTQHRADGEVFLLKLESLLSQNTYLLQTTPSLVDIAIFPFIRQFAAVDNVWFESSPYPKLRAWLSGWVESELFKSVMIKNPT
jgi:glutathione S-transferase